MYFNIFKFNAKAVLSAAYLFAATSLVYGGDGIGVDDDGVLLLNRTNFRKALRNNKYLLVKFYASWCHHCRALSPEYAKAAKMLDDRNVDIKLAKVDAVEDVKLAIENDIRGYPTLKYFVNGRPIHLYTGKKKAEDIVDWVVEKRQSTDSNIEL